MLAVLLMSALASQALTAPTNCGTLCDPYTGHQVAGGSGQNAGGYSSYSKWGSSSSWSSGSLDSAYGSTHPARLESFDEGNVIGSSTLDRPGSWSAEKSYVTDDRKGKIDYKAAQEVTANSYKKYAESSYSYGTNAHHEPKSNSQIIHHTQFEPRIQDVQRDMDAFMGKFSFNTGSVVNQHTLDNFRSQAQRLSNQVSSLCDQADINSEEYRRLQRIKQNFERQVQERQQEIMNIVFESSHSISDNVSNGGGTFGSQYAHPHYSTSPIYQPSLSTLNPQVAESERLQQECNKLRNNIDNFYTNFVTADYGTYDHEDTLAAFRAQVSAQVTAINQQIANLRVDSANFEYQRKFVEDMSRTFETYVQNLNSHIEDGEKRIRAEQLRLIQEEERLNNERLERERIESEEKYQASLRLAQQKHEQEQREIAEQQALEAEKARQKKLEAERVWQQRQEEERQRLIVQQQQRPQPQIQPSLPQVQTVAPSNVDVSQSNGWSHKYDVHISGSQHHEVSASGSGGVTTNGQQQQHHQQLHQYQPVQIGPHIDVTEINNKMNQEFNRLVSSVSSLASYSMQLTESNQNTLNAQFQRDVNNLRQNIENLRQQSSQYHNERVLKAAEDLKQNLEQSYQYFQQELAKLTSSGGYQDNSSWQAAGRYTNVRQPHISNVEISHSKSTEIELSHQARGNAAGSASPAAGQQQVTCVEQYANQPCVESARVRREAGGYYSQQHESSLDEYTPRRSSYQRHRTYKPEDDDYSQSYVDPHFELDYSQRTGLAELPRNRQPIRSESFGKRAETQSHHAQQQQRQVEDSMQGGNISSDYQTQRNQLNHRSISMYDQQESEDLSQQNVQNQKNEDFESYQKPRRETVQVTPKFERLENFEDGEQSSRVDDRQRGSLHRTQHVQTANLQREQPSTSTGRTLFDQRLVVDEPREFVKPIVKPDKFGSVRGNDGYTLDKSGFYDNPKIQENSKLIENLPQQSSEKPVQIETLEIHGKSIENEGIQKPLDSSAGKFTLGNSGFEDHHKRHEHQYVSVTESPAEQLTTFKSLENSQQLEDLTLQRSGFFENSGQAQHSEQLRVADVSTITESNEDLVQQQSNLGRSYERDDRDSTQQSAVQINFSPDIQSGRRSSLNFERINSYYDDTQRNSATLAPLTQNRQYDERNKHPVGQYIHNLPQKIRPSSSNVVDHGSNKPIGQYDNAYRQLTEIIPNQQSLVTVYPVVKPVSRYTNLQQVNQNINDLQQTENSYFGQSNQNPNIEPNSSSYSSNESNKPFEPHRGDLPGHSEPITQEPAYIPIQSTPVPITKSTTQASITEKSIQKTFEPEVATETTPCFSNRCQLSQFGQSGQSYYYHQQNQHNIRFSHQSTYKNPQNLGTRSSFQLQSPFHQQQVSPVNYAPEGGYNFRYRDQETNHLRINHHESTFSSATEPTPVEKSDLFKLNNEESSQQQVQKPSFDNLSGHGEFTKHRSTFTFNQQTSQTSDDDVLAKVIPLDETRARNIWADVESSTQPTFWKKVGHKLSNAYEKAKESARTVYG